MVASFANIFSHMWDAFTPCLWFSLHMHWENLIQKDTGTLMFTEALFIIARIWKQPKCPLTDKWIKKMYNKLLHSHKKEKNWVIFRVVDGSKVYHTEWSKSEREKYIFHTKACLWNPEKWYWWACLQGEIEMQTHRHGVGDGITGWIERLGLTYIHYCFCC